jgi:hypothetical protein
MPRFQDIPKFTRQANYGVDIPWSYLEEHLNHQVENGLNLDPDFQRAHVWTGDQQSAYIEFCLRGGLTGRAIQTNCPDWNSGGRSDYVLVDGKQRLTAIRAFLRNEVSVFGGSFYGDFTDKLHTFDHSIRWHVNDLKTRAEVLQWYLDFNTGGVVHTREEISKVETLLSRELSLWDAARFGDEEKLAKLAEEVRAHDPSFTLEAFKDRFAEETKRIRRQAETKAYIEKQWEKERQREVESKAQREQWKKEDAERNAARQLTLPPALRKGGKRK